MNDTLEAPKSRSGRTIKLRCAAGEDYLVAISRTRLTTLGAPSCPCHNTTMEEV
ncbi:hypothetical protein QDW26_gp50 [Microbacterium phage Didgeridoo]|uniref:hypothetical protein n=1 Tax=Microbacterium phage Didgeridoo TaxID=2126928 RepID=UPI000D20E043|nr:hypothetical protein QDW26_gp50 [Microbacterium phage Didgeridoo]YP_010752991.1 hypothetical protein QDW27_gp48 [Microbacterium phage IndyLu]AVR56716.1 hypothetical protein PBI_DIDGERIDOO_51 [Microbacterium phage Didgeridoo]UDG78750.1 hypothetical protein SEA_INDYLU_48 [Microbacterium phage IndyLu]